MSNKSNKIIVDVSMLVFIVLSLIRWDGDPTFHIVVGSACTLFFSIHVFLNRKWLVSLTNNFKIKKSNAKIKRQYILDVFLLIVWSIAIITGFLAISPYLSELENISRFGRIHGVSARLGCVLVLVHICLHLGQIRSYFKRTN